MAELLQEQFSTATEEANIPLMIFMNTARKTDSHNRWAALAYVGTIQWPKVSSLH